MPESIVKRKTRILQKRVDRRLQMCKANGHVMTNPFADGTSFVCEECGATVAWKQSDGSSVLDCRLNARCPHA